MSGAGPLDWPDEAARPAPPDDPSFRVPGSNITLDFHGDPARAGLAVFSDGNHHMALADCVARFLTDNPDVEDVFYATTPPGPLARAVEAGRLHLGNLTLSRQPDVFIGPADILDRLVAGGHMARHDPFAESLGQSLLLRKGNPKGITNVADLARDDVRLALSHPKNEHASHQVYAETILRLADDAKREVLARLVDGTSDRVVLSQAIHHREIPQLLADDRADAAVVYHHLALRYIRIFPDTFDMLALGDAAAHPVTRYHIGLIADGGAWGATFVDFMRSETAGTIYQEHGLRRPAP